MELRQLRYFVAVAEECSFGRAAERLHTVQPALSRQIGALERELGFTLFNRNPRPVSLTPAAVALLTEVRTALQHIDRAVENAKLTARGELGTLEIGYILPAMWTMLMPILREYRARLPQMGFDLIELDGHIQLERLREGSLDIGFVRPTDHDDVIVFETIMSENWVVALPADHPQTAVPEVDLADLSNETFIVMNRQRAPASHDLHFSLFREHGFTPKTIEGNTASSLNLVALGVAVAIVPESLRNVGIGGVAFRPMSGPTPQLELAVAYRRDAPSPAVDGFLEIVRDVTALSPG